MLRYRRIKVRKISEELIDALAIYLCVESIDSMKLKHSCEKFKIYGMSLSKFLNCDFNISNSSELRYPNEMFINELFFLQELFKTYGKAFLVTTPKIQFVDFEKTTTKIKNQLISEIKTNCDFWCPYIIYNFYYDHKNSIVNFTEVSKTAGSGVTNYKISYYFKNDDYVQLSGTNLICSVRYDKEMIRYVHSDHTTYYDSFKNVSKILENNIYERCSIKNVYNKNNELIECHNISDNVNTKRVFEYDSNGNCIQIKEFIDGILKRSAVFEYMYRRNKLIKAKKTTTYHNSHVSNYIFLYKCRN